ncbi:MAG TPA: hypothetical protein VJB08_04340 [Candidatus Nanoarchaeia archaeon]|nr:hypothetical protein [Candidatus Nanoarchaeia archaeon]
MLRFQTDKGVVPSGDMSVIPITFAAEPDGNLEEIFREAGRVSSTLWATTREILKLNPLHNTTLKTSRTLKK